MNDNEEKMEMLPPHEAFAIMGNKIRIEILRTLWEHRQEPVSFVDLYDKVDVDDTGQFNYHLNRLVSGNYVGQSDEGRYALRNTGRQVVLAILSSISTENFLRDPVPVGTSCYGCKSAIEAWYEDGWLHVECRSCGQIYSGRPFPSAGFKDRTIEEILTVFDQRHKQMIELAGNGSCPACAAQVSTSPHVKSDDEPGPAVVVRHDCSNCGLQVYSPVGLSILNHPPVAGFLKDHDIDPSSVFVWELKWCYDESCMDVRSKDPLTIVLRVPAGSEQLSVTLDESFSVSSTERISN